MIRFKRKIEDYTVMSKLGRGRYGVCYLAQDIHNCPKVLKRFYPRRWKKNRKKNHFEAVILSSVQHPAIPQFLGVINNRKGYFFVLEYKPGATLENLLFHQRKQFSHDDIYRIGSQLLNILSFLHSQNIVHRDVSITNVMDDGSQISLIDFGLARFADGDRIRFDMDYSCFGNLLLYLLYSGFQGKSRRPWYLELPLSANQKEYLKKLMGLEPPFESCEEILTQFDACFFPGDSHCERKR